MLYIYTYIYVYIYIWRGVLPRLHHRVPERRSQRSINRYRCMDLLLSISIDRSIETNIVDRVKPDIDIDLWTYVDQHIDRYRYR